MRILSFLATAGAAAVVAADATTITSIYALSYTRYTDTYNLEPATTTRSVERRIGLTISTVPTQASVASTTTITFGDPFLSTTTALVKIYINADYTTELPTSEYTPFRYPTRTSSDDDFGFGDPYPTTTPDSDGEKYFAKGVTISAPTNCRKQWTIVQATTTNIPSGARQSSAISSATSTDTITPTRSYYFDSYTTTVYHLPVNEEERTSLLSALSTASRWHSITKDERISCAVQPAETTGSSYYGNPIDHLLEQVTFGPDNEDGDDGSSRVYTEGFFSSKRFWADRYRKTAIIAFICVWVALLALGFVESRLWFGRMMKGETALRGGTVCWAVATLVAACFIKRQIAKPGAEEREECRRKWAAKGFGERTKLWMTWGLTWKYPTELLGARPVRSRSATVVVRAGKTVDKGVSPMSTIVGTPVEQRPASSLAPPVSPAPPAPAEVRAPRPQMTRTMEPIPESAQGRSRADEEPGPSMPVPRADTPQPDDDADLYSVPRAALEPVPAERAPTSGPPQPDDDADLYSVPRAALGPVPAERAPTSGPPQPDDDADLYSTPRPAASDSELARGADPEPAPPPQTGEEPGLSSPDHPTSAPDSHTR